MIKACQCGNFRHNSLYSEDQCWRCWLYFHNAGYRATVNGEVKPNTQKKCLYLGEPTGEQVECPSCGEDKDGKKKTRIKLFACAVHGKCTPQTPLPGIACCPCPDYKSS